jgi:CRP/FNR family transcriptional regulator
MKQDNFTNLKLFEGLDSEQLAKIKPLFEPCQYRAGEIIFKQGDQADSLYIVVDGVVDIRFDPHDGEMLTVATIEKDGVFGWSAVFGTDTYTSGAICLKDAQLLSVDGCVLKEFNKKDPKTCILVLNRFAKVVAQRLKRSHRHSQVVAMLENGLNDGIKSLGGRS